MSKRLKAKVRYRHLEQWTTFTQLDLDTLEIRFDIPHRAFAKGQAVVLYDIDCVVGVGRFSNVQAIPFDNGTWEVSYHIGSDYTKRGYATEDVKAFLLVIMSMLGITRISGICLADNKSSIK